MSDFSFRALVRNILDETDLTSPDEIAEKVAASIPKDKLRLVLALTLRDFVRIEMTRARACRTSRQPPSILSRAGMWIMTGPKPIHVDHRAQPDRSVVVYHWPIVPEAYCVDSGRAVRHEAGDRCIRHGDRGVACTTAVRMPGKCEHRNLSPNHPGPRCSECGLDPLSVEVRS